MKSNFSIHADTWFSTICRKIPDKARDFMIDFDEHVGGEYGPCKVQAERFVRSIFIRD